MPNTVWPTIHCKRVRITRLDVCGRPIVEEGNKSMLVTKGAIRVGVTFNYEDGEETTVKNGNGEICVFNKDPDQLKSIGLELQLCGVDPEAYELITGMPLVTNGAGDAVGIKLSRQTIETRFALEAWTDVPGQACDDEGNAQYGYLAVTCVGAGRVSDFELAVGAAEFSLSATSEPINGWGEGPYAVMLDENGDPSPLLDPLTDQEPGILTVVNMAPPEPTEGAVELVAFTPENP